MVRYFKFFLLFFLSHYIFSQTLLNELKSPVTTDAKNPFYYTAGLTLVTAILKNQVVDPVQDEISSEKPLGKASQVGDTLGLLVPNTLYYIGMKTSYWRSDNLESNLNAEIMLKASIYSTLVTQVLKYTIREPRPNGKDRKSFPSGHTTSAFAFASVVEAVHGLKWGIPAYAIAGFVGFSRINDNAHYLHDVLGGAAIGMGYGLGITYLLKKEQANTNLTVYPLMNRDSTGLGFAYTY